MLGKVLLIILIMNVGQSPLLRIPLHFVSSSGHQAVHHIQRIVADTFQDKSANDDGEEVITGDNWWNWWWAWYLPSELSSRQGGSHPLYFCSRTCRSPGSRPGGWNNPYVWLLSYVCTGYDNYVWLVAHSLISVLLRDNQDPVLGSPGCLCCWGCLCHHEGGLQV